jgi:hypothetical protein
MKCNLPPLPPERPDLILLGEAARIVQRHPDTVKKWIREGRPAGSRKVVGRWMVSRESLAALMAGPAPTSIDRDPGVANPTRTESNNFGDQNGN